MSSRDLLASTPYQGYRYKPQHPAFTWDMNFRCPQYLKRQVKYLKVLGQSQPSRHFLKRVLNLQQALELTLGSFMRAGELALPLTSCLLGRAGPVPCLGSTGELALKFVFHVAEGTRERCPLLPSFFGRLESWPWSQDRRPCTSPRQNSRDGPGYEGCRRAAQERESAGEPALPLVCCSVAQMRERCPPSLPCPSPPMS